MALSDCPKCWDTPCTCGHGYKDWSRERLSAHISTLQGVLGAREDANPERLADLCAKDLGSGRRNLPVGSGISMRYGLHSKEYAIAWNAFMSGYDAGRVQKKEATS